MYDNIDYLGLIRNLDEMIQIIGKSRFQNCHFVIDACRLN